MINRQLDDFQPPGSKGEPKKLFKSWTLTANDLLRS